MCVQVRQDTQRLLSVCEQRGTDTVQLDYDPHRPFDICSITFTPIYRGSACAEDPYTKARQAARSPHHVCCKQPDLQVSNRCIPWQGASIPSDCVHAQRCISMQRLECAPAAGLVAACVNAARLLCLVHVECLRLMLPLMA